MRVLLLSSNTETINMPALPLGLASVAAATQAAGHEVRVVDLLGQEDARTVLRETIQEFNPEVIGLSVRNIDDQRMEPSTFLLSQVKGVVSDCRRLSSAAIVLGGAGYSIFPQSTLTYLGADMGIQGEGEKVFVSLLERLSRKADLSGIPGLYVPKKNLQCEMRVSRDLDNFPLPLPDRGHWSLSIKTDSEIWLPFQTRRGCPMGCNYCSTAAIEGRLIRKRSPARVVEALSRYKEAGIERFFFVDNTFNFPPSYAKAICEALVQADLGILWRCIIYPNKVDNALVELMAKAGCDEVSLGFESGSTDILRIMNKKFLPKDVRLISERFKKNGIRQMGFLLLGGPGETRETVEESVAFAESLELETMKISAGIRIYPHTAIARAALEDGMIAPDDNLLFPRYYMVKGIEDWLKHRVNCLLSERPNWVN